MNLERFNFNLPEHLIAQRPLPERSASRLLCLSKGDVNITHRYFYELPSLLHSNDLLVFNNTKVIKARLLGKKNSGGAVEILVERIINDQQVLAQIGTSKKIKIGMEIILADDCYATVVGKQNNFFLLQFFTAMPVLAVLQKYGHVPLPPYVARADDNVDETRYQSIFAEHEGAVAAPTASLHFDENIIAALKAKNIAMAFVTLHVGAGTFQPVRVADITQHKMHAEYMEVTEDVCAKIKATRARGGRVIAVGTTCVRCLETAAQKGRGDILNESRFSGLAQIDSSSLEFSRGGKERATGVYSDIHDCRERRRQQSEKPKCEEYIVPFCGDTDIFIYPGFNFQCVDALITNFHLPKSTLLMLVCAFAGYDNVMRTYEEAIAHEYRFFSYGDAMFIG